VTLTTPIKLPPVLEGSRAGLMAALVQPALAEWPENTAYVDARQAEAIAGTLRPVLHQHLKGARIVHLFKERLSDCSGKASKASPKLQYLANLDFMVEYCWTTWRTLSGTQRIALVDHELTHFDRDIEKEKWVMKEHDIEEFGSIVSRWGLWHPRLVQFGGAVQDRLQTELALEELRPQLEGAALAVKAMRATETGVKLVTH
jgi:hypothetical protein